LPAIDPARSEFVLQLGAQQIRGSVSAKAARKLAAHAGSAVLQGRLVDRGDKLVLLEAGFQFIDPKPQPQSATTAATHEATSRDQS
jgi:hypothetical protein